MVWLVVSFADQAFRTTALRWEQQQRAFAEFQPKKNLYQLDASGDDLPNQLDMTASDGDGNWNLDAMGDGPKCGKCGSRKDSSNVCDADLSKVRCFKC